jgi:hypothetical protein
MGCPGSSCRPSLLSIRLPPAAASNSSPPTSEIPIVVVPPRERRESSQLGADTNGFASSRPSSPLTCGLCGESAIGGGGAFRKGRARRDPTAARLARRRSVFAVHPESPIRGPKYSIIERQDAGVGHRRGLALLDSIDVSMSVGSRGRRATMVYTFAMFGAVMKVED